MPNVVVNEIVSSFFNQMAYMGGHLGFGPDMPLIVLCYSGF